MSGRLHEGNPWPDLESFGSGDAAFFRGRDQEGETLLEEVRRARLVVLFGASGLGKTSLVHAGLSPRLAAEGCFLVPLQLGYKPELPSIAAQVFDALVKSCPATVRLAAPRPEETVWEYLHRRESAIEGLQPLFFFDQFEELFTIGAGTEHAADAKGMLRALIEGAPPKEVREFLDRTPEAARLLSFHHHPYRALIGVRDDFLSQLETLRPEIPSIIHHRIGLLPLSGEAALDVVMQPPRTTGGGGPASRERAGLVEKDVAELIVRTVVSAREMDTRRLEALEVEPALLSVFCSELNRKRLKRDQALPPSTAPSRITRDLVTGSRTEIISAFYDRAVRDAPPSVRTFIEEKLVTELGYRMSAVLDEALAVPGFTRALLDELVKRRLLRTFERSHVLWVELTHDVLTTVVSNSRYVRRDSEHRALLEAQREEQRRRDEDARIKTWKRRIVFVAGLCVLVGALGWERARETHLRFEQYKTNETERREEETRRRQELARTLLRVSLEARHYREALAQLANAIREDPSARRLRLLLTDLVKRQNWALPGDPMFPEGPFTWVVCARTTPRCAAAYRDGRVLVRGNVSLDLSTQQRGYTDLFFSKDGDRLIGLPESSGTGNVWEVPHGGSTQFPTENWDVFDVSSKRLAMIGSNGPEVVLKQLDGTKEYKWTGSRSPLQVTISEEGRWAASQDTGKTVELVDVQTGQRRTFGREATGAIKAIALDPKGQLLAVSTNDGRVALWRTADGGTVAQVDAPATVNAIVFRADGRGLAASSEDGSVWIWSEPWSRTLVNLSEPGPNVMNLVFSPSGDRLAFTRRDGTVGVFDVKSGSRWAPIHHPSLALTSFIDEATLLTASLDGSTSVWSLPAASSKPVTNLEAAITAAWFTGEEDVHLDGEGVIADWSGGRLQKQKVSTHTIVSRDRRLRASTYTTDVKIGPLTGDDSFLTKGNSTQSAFSEDGNRFLTLIDDTAQLWDTATRAMIGKPVGPVSGAWLSRDGKVLATKGWNPGVTIQELLPDGSFSAPEIVPSTTVVNFASFDEAAERLVMVSENRAFVWSRKRHELVGRPIIHNGSIIEADFSRDGQWLVTTSQDKTARVWEASTGEPVSDWLPHDAAVYAADFSPSGRRLITACRNGRVWIWDILTDLDASPEQTKQLATLAEILAGLRVDPKTNELVPLDSPYGALAALRAQIGDGILCNSANHTAGASCTPSVDDYMRGILRR